MVIFVQLFIAYDKIMVTVADSIGIKLLSPDCLLAGIGNVLHQYYLNATKETIHRQISLGFRSKIHGIAKYDDPNAIDSTQFVVVYGGRQLAVLLLSSNYDLKLVKILSLNDWISSAQVYKPKPDKKGDEISFCTVSAHSVACEFKINTNGEWSIVNKASCDEKCTLYCSAIIGYEWIESTVFGGTAFGELIIWKTHGEGMQREVFHRLSGHNGVIFSIDCSLHNNTITTTSDDRSIKIWNIINPKADSFTESTIDWSKVSVEPSRSMFGHFARIFNHKIVECNGKVYAITVGEDGYVCIWSPDDGHLVRREFLAPNVPLWNCDFDPTRQYLYACGNDGNIHQLNLKSILNETKIACESLTIDDFDEDEHVTKLVVMEESSIILLLTNKQNFFYGDIPDELSECRWDRLLEAENGYKITALETYGSLVASVGCQFITIYQYKNGKFNKVHHSKPPSSGAPNLFRSVNFLTEKEIVVCNAQGNASLLTFDESFNIVRDQKFALPPCKERWITVARRFDNFLVVGNRHGHLHLYEINDTLLLKHTLHHVHGSYGCKSIWQTATDGRLQFQSAGHQSRVKTIVINAETQQMELNSTHEIPVIWCDKVVHEIDVNHNLLLAGFNERQFIAWKNDDTFRFEYECGGGRRAWGLHLNRATSRAHWFFVRHQSLNGIRFDLHDNSLHPLNIPKTNWHLRPCNTMRIIELTKQRFLIASGGDDNLLKFNEIDMTKSIKLQHKFDMVLHISTIKAIYSLRLSADATADCENWLIFSAGGRAQMCVTDVRIDEQRNVQFYESCEFTLSLDSHRKRTKPSQAVSFDPETRFMSLIAYPRANDISIVVGCSDGFVRSFTYANKSITLNTATFYGRCFLNVHYFEYANQNYLMTMATDGLIAFWSLDDFDEHSKPFCNIQHHDSGINGFDVLRDNSNRMNIATGGDDQAIVISILQLDTKLESNRLTVSVVKTVKFGNQHTAQVNGVKFSVDRRYLYSASVDQTIMRVDMDDFSIKQIAYSCISDAKGLQIIDSKNILVHGGGVQTLNV